MSEEHIDFIDSMKAPREFRVGKKIFRSKRRMRDSSGDRNFSCGCRKSYLTYSSLYTHVKNKHSSIFPNGSIARIKVKIGIEDQPENIVVPNILKFYDDFQESVNSIPLAFNKLQRTMNLSDIPKTFIFFADQPAFEANKLWESFEVVMSFRNFEDPTFKSSINIYKVLAFYLFSIYQFCGDVFFSEYIVLAVWICKCLNENGNKIANSYMRTLCQRNVADKHGAYSSKNAVGDGDLMEDSFCESVNIFMISESLNLFISEHFPIYFNVYKQTLNKFNFLGLNVDNIQNLVIMLRLLGNWLFHAELTDFKMEINNDL